MGVRDELMEGRQAIPRVGRVVEVNRAHPPYAVFDATGVEVEPVTAFLRDLALGDSSPLTCRSYSYGLLRWFRLLWLLGTGWERATESEVSVLTGWLRLATRQLLPDDEYRDTTSDEWNEFEEHFDKPKVELGACGRPYGTPCQHEHACIRCPMLHVSQKMISRLDDLEDDLVTRRTRAQAEGWAGEIEDSTSPSNSFAPNATTLTAAPNAPPSSSASLHPAPQEPRDSTDTHSSDSGSGDCPVTSLTCCDQPYQRRLALLAPQ